LFILNRAANIVIYWKSAKSGGFFVGNIEFLMLNEWLEPIRRGGPR
jgi:hypothetical protein